MHFQDDFISVPLPWQVIALTALSCLLVLFFFVFFGAGVGGILTIIMIFGLLAFNILGLWAYHFYVPLFSPIYFSLLAFLFCGFGRLSYEAFSKWLVKERRNQYIRTADLKSNFISLFSHNLNTPIAKMQGMISILLNVPQANEVKPSLKTIESLVAKLEVCIRSILVSTALDNESLHRTPMRIEELIDEFDSAVGSSLKRIGVDYNIRLEVEDEDLKFYPLSIDKRAFSVALSAILVLFTAKTKGSIDIVWRLTTNPENDDTVILTLSLGGVRTGGQYFRLQSLKVSKKPVADLEAEAAVPFFDEVLLNLARQIDATYPYALSSHTNEDKGSVDISFTMPIMV